MRSDHRSPPKLGEDKLLSGFWTWDVRQDRIFGCENLVEYFGFEMQTASAGLTLADYTGRIDRLDRQRVGDAITKSIVDRSPFRETYRVHTKSLGVRQILAQGRCYYNDTAQPSLFPGWFIDVSDVEVEATDASPLLLVRHLTELARDAAVKGRHSTLVYLLELALLETKDQMKLSNQKATFWH